MEFFRTEFYRMCRKLFLVSLTRKETKNDRLQILLILYNTDFSNYKNETY